MNALEKKIYLGLVVCLLVSVVGVSFAYFTSKPAVQGEGGSNRAKTSDLIKVEYDAGVNTINLQNAVPGEGTEKSFSVKVSPGTDVKEVTYGIVLNIANNDFIKCTNASNCAVGAEELVYTLKDDNDTIISTGDLLEKSGKIELKKITKTVNEETRFNYKLDITFKNTGNNQNHNANKSFSGLLLVEFAEKNND